MAAKLLPPESSLGAFAMSLRSDVSLDSLFTPGMTVGVADRRSAIALEGPRERLLRDCSLLRARSMVLGFSPEAGRLVAAPGLVSGFFVEGLLARSVFGGETITGPPNFRLIPSQGSGRRAAKLDPHGQYAACIEGSVVLTKA